ncbi:hypothetical protein P8452_67166 [Trifolium repens]|nr:hypothetical protein P8452_67166 [Trifolium repens]
MRNTQHIPYHFINVIGERERERERERRNSLRLRLSRNRLQPPTRPPHSKSSVATIEIVRRHIEIARRFSSVKHSRRFHSFDFKSLFGFPSLNFASTEENLTPTVERCYNPNCDMSRLYMKDFSIQLQGNIQTTRVI